MECWWRIQFITTHLCFCCTLLLVHGFQIYPDPEVMVEVMTSNVRCVHFQDGCRWIDKLQNMQVLCKERAIKSLQAIGNPRILIGNHVILPGSFRGLSIRQHSVSQWLLHHAVQAQPRRPLAVLLSSEERCMWILYQFLLWGSYGGKWYDSRPWGNVLSYKMA